VRVLFVPLENSNGWILRGIIAGHRLICCCAKGRGVRRSRLDHAAHRAAHITGIAGAKLRTVGEDHRTPGVAVEHFDIGRISGLWVLPGASRFRGGRRAVDDVVVPGRMSDLASGGQLETDDVKRRNALVLQSGAPARSNPLALLRHEQ
jgi:hypothetical protein